MRVIESMLNYLFAKLLHALKVYVGNIKKVSNISKKMYNISDKYVAKIQQRKIILYKYPIIGQIGAVFQKKRRKSIKESLNCVSVIFIKIF